MSYSPEVLYSITTSDNAVIIAAPRNLNKDSRI